ncbi:hypothetical protein [Pseudomonas sp. DR 5-09]|uniref:hypothetical protein n=1 Tax=Pseudomonas sp. DR 5-09 TaxID=1534110 RepID=UPI0007E48571|nr:hypothetical protein [Pseudomonas sp. DR 5-09]
MKITIIRIIKILTESIYIEFSSPYGKGFSNLIAPEAKENQSYDIEMDIGDEFSWNKNIMTSEETTPSIRSKPDATYITAELTSITDDGCGVLKLGNSVIFLSLEGHNQNLMLPTFIELSTNDLSFYLTNI